ncbi:MAG: hypothetical protein WCF67_12770, partial [Chitinophagaceae bacterium]
LDSIAERRFVISNRLFEAGKISLTDLQFSQREKDNARRNFIRTLRRLEELKFSILSKTGLRLL